jgi:glycosyltransferase involved in cell wall biosynthesis
MILGFHYHSNFTYKNDKIYVPGYIGVFIEELAKNCTELYLFLEIQSNNSSTEEDFELNQKNIKIINLGPKSTFYYRLLYPQKKLNIIGNHIHKLDYFLLRAPTPLAPHIFKKFQLQLPINILLVGNYVNGLKHLEQPFLRKIGIILLTHYYQILENRMILNQNILVNSVALYEQNKTKAKKIEIVKTTTLDRNSFFERVDSCNNESIRILYTGRINFQKGIRELIHAVAILCDKYNIIIDIVGWEEQGSFSYEKGLKLIATENGIEEKIIFHGKKEIGPELNTYYRNADIYAIPSYHEGFPRTIWEAMANSLPVIATNVGSIPYYLQNNENALIIEPYEITSLVTAIETLINNPDIRRSLIKNGYNLAKEVTLEIQTQKLINLIQKK